VTGGEPPEPARGSAILRFCEMCGRDQATITGGRLSPTAEGLYVCPECERGASPSRWSHAATAARAWAGSRGHGYAVAGGAVLVAALAVAIQMSGALEHREEGTLGITEAAPAGSAAPTTHVAVGSSTEASPSPRSVGPSVSPSEAPPPPAVAYTTAPPALVTWKGAFGETRVQVIVPVRNDGEGWMSIPRSGSTYRLLDSDSEVASGIFTAALPSTIGPGQTGYLIDTLSATFVSSSEPLSTTAEVKVVPSEAPTYTLSVSNLRASVGTEGGLRVEGRVQNDGRTATTWVIAGAVAVGSDGRPLGAVYEPSDIGRLEPGSSFHFTCEYPGAPPVTNAARLVGVAFDAIDGPGS
jgi:hypothetical protein